MLIKLLISIIGIILLLCTAACLNAASKANKWEKEIEKENIKNLRINK